MNKITPYLKAITGFLAPGIVALAAAATDASPGGQTIVQGEWLAALAACVVTGSLVFAVPNKDATGTHQDESVQPPEGDSR